MTFIKCTKPIKRKKIVKMKVNPSKSMLSTLSPKNLSLTKLQRTNMIEPLKKLARLSIRLRSPPCKLKSNKKTRLTFISRRPPRLMMPFIEQPLREL